MKPTKKAPSAAPKADAPNPRVVAAELLLEQLPSDFPWVGDKQDHGLLPEQIRGRFHYVDKILAHVAPGSSCAKLFAPLGDGLGEWLDALAKTGFLVIEDDIVFLTKKGAAWLAKGKEPSRV